MRPHMVGVNAYRARVIRYRKRIVPLPAVRKAPVGMPPQLHRQVAILAKKRQMSLNSFVEKALTDEVALLQRAH